MKYKISPSLLCADHLHLEEQLKVINSQADYLHLDLMDTRFVPTMGLFPRLIEAVAKKTVIPMDCHLMVEDPVSHIDWMSKAGISVMIPHIEAVKGKEMAVIEKIHKAGMKAGLAISPDTKIESVIPFLSSLERVTIMTVTPGFPGAVFQWDMIEKINSLKKIKRKNELSFEIEMDGSLSEQNLKRLMEAGCEVYVAGDAALFQKGRNLKDNFAGLKKLFCESMDELEGEEYGS